ncbi:MAG: exosortase/archaeosortase family protein, partial [Candidatus Diapherotrites archaeon]|nr:exosortase/archaeosortase family protein [Candidatus Diapherotrites archaeon]MBT4596808.1 exosortase/archaeosortase family protein [Candidatus Diapherotrites archaeon]
MKNKNGFVSFIIEYLKEKEEEIKSSQKKQFTFFMLGFVLSYLILTGITYLIPEIFFDLLTGLGAKGLLQLQGLEVIEFIGENYQMLVGPAGSGKTIIISWLCSGVLEIIILVSAMLASFGISWKKKFIGIIFAIIVGYVFNLLRVWTTINIILTQNVQTIEFAHDFLFRAVLFVYIIVFYVAWF